jgi:putative ABC transport system substrate-binding protein
MGKKTTILAMAFAILAFAQPSYAQQAGKKWQIGTLSNGSPASHGHYLQWYRQGFKQLGYVEGRDYVFVSRWARGKQKLLPALAKELIAAKVDVIMVSGGTPVRSAAKVTNKIPIVVGSASGLGTWGLAASLARPGGNVTGSTAFDPGLEGKRLGLLREAAPGARRVAFMFQPKKRGRAELKRTETAARSLGVTIKSLPVRTLGEIENAFASMAKNKRVDALILSSTNVIYYNRKRVTELVTEWKLPAICARQKIAKTGCLMAYVPDRSMMNRRAAIFVDKILRGANPGDLPIERPTKYKLMVNLKLAKAIGISIPPSILLRATEVIE